MFKLMVMWNFITSFVAFGGGSSLFSYLHDIYVIKLHLLSEAEFLRICIITEIVPGPVAISFLSVVGFKIGGVLGWIASVMSFAMFTMIGSYFFYFYAFKSKFIQNIAKYILPIIIMALLAMVIKMLNLPFQYSLNYKHLIKIVMMVVLSLTLMKFKVSNVINIFSNIGLASILVLVNF